MKLLFLEMVYLATKPGRLCSQSFQALEAMSTDGHSDQG